MSTDEPRLSTNVREKGGQRPILSSLLGALQPSAFPEPSVENNILVKRLQGSEERLHEERKFHAEARGLLFYTFLI